MRCLFGLMLLLCLPAFGQHQPTSDNIETYSAGLSRGTIAIRTPSPSDSPWRTKFYLVTSWIPGREHKGYFRYQLRTSLVYAPVGEAVAAQTMPQAFSEFKKCSFFLELYDDGGFVLDKIPLYFQEMVGDTGAVTGMVANDSFQMDLYEYKKFIHAGLRAGPEATWNISYTCPTNN